MFLDRKRMATQILDLRVVLCLSLLFHFREMTVLKFCIIFVFFGFSLQAKIINSQSLICNPNDLDALVSFWKNLELGVEGWGIDSSSPDCCSWAGITCNSSSSLGLNEANVTGRVVKLDLGRKGIAGNLSESLGSLDQLRTLDLSHNFIKGPIPGSLFHLPALEVLDLSYNHISGWFPADINVPSIRVLDVSENSIIGPVPLGICSNSTKISVLNLGANYFSRCLPLELGNCTSLQDFTLAANDLSGRLPEDLFRLSNLRNLALQENMFSGQLSGLIGNLSNLVHLDLSFNEFSGNIPDVFHNFLNMKSFSAQSNYFNGTLPNSLTSSGTLTSLSLRNNSLVGTIDFNCTAMLNLVSLDLATNQFHGKIPDNLPTCPRLKAINFAKINFKGQIPESFMNFQSLSYLSLSNSSVLNLTAALDILQHCKNLTTLILTLNFHGESMPSYPSLQFSGLRALVIANCGLTGIIPQWLKGSTKLQLLDLSWNLLEGTIPSWFGNFSSLFYLDLSNNSFTGHIPEELTTLQTLIYGDITLKEPSPDFTYFVKKNTSLRGYPYKQILSFPPTLELGNNFLTGPIWPDFGNLKELHIFDLKCNNLSGTIPSSLSGMRSLETLDFSFNNLNGTIPSSLSSLSFLSKFSVAHNDLSGPIPPGVQFSTFPNSSFEGNPLLCGEHASHPCVQASSVPPEKSKKRPRGATIAMAVGIGLGTVSFLAITFVIILRGIRQKVVDPEMEDAIANEKDFDELGSSLVILCQNENDKEIFLDDLLKATDNFDQSNIIGCGGFGLVYRAVLPCGMKLAIKRLSGEYYQMEREFHAEIETLSRVQHPNLVRLQGYSKYKNDRLLVYSYMENGSLDYWLHEKNDGPPYLDWKARLQIAQGSARGLAYLHQSCEPHILHRDIKSSNILLNEKFEARLADFGLARLILPYDTHVSTDLVGTLGYIPPEYSQASVATYKGDIYSFGVVLLELLTSKRPMDMCRPKEYRDLISWVLQMKREKREIEVFDLFIYEKQYAEEMLAVFEIACLCLNESPRIRPCTQQLVTWLDNINSTTSFRSHQCKTGCLIPNESSPLLS
ncbi:phytosulfokine receptor 1-like [Primulina eburnea]|uniref:phytosulfokine receptor 1-like n=1 Tax=Primulina eburnea TaxID=1245227 RepID=UPI003C6C7A0B